jgi:hypothetical protein
MVNACHPGSCPKEKVTVPHLRRMLRLLTVAVLVVVGSFAAVSKATAGETHHEGIDPRALVVLCDRYQGRYLEELPKPYSYGCDLSDGQIGCLETTECSFRRLGDRPPFEERCERVGGKFSYKDFSIFSCWTEEDTVLVFCDETWSECGITSLPNEQPMPIPSDQDTNLVRTRDASAWPS